MVLNIGQIGGTGRGGGTNWYIALDASQAGASKTTPTVLRCPSIRLDAAHADNPYLFQAIVPGAAPAKFRIVGAVIDAPTNNAAALLQLYDTLISFEGCTLNQTARNSSKSNCVVVFDVGTGTELAEFSASKIDKPVWVNLALNSSDFVMTNRHSQTLTADNSTVATTNVALVALSSDNGTAANRTFVLTPGLFKGQRLTLEWVGTNAGEIADDSSNSGGGNNRLASTWTPTQYDTLNLEFNGTDWIERGRSTN
jgi:hypothetical protein